MVRERVEEEGRKLIMMEIGDKRGDGEGAIEKGK